MTSPAHGPTPSGSHVAGADTAALAACVADALVSAYGVPVMRAEAGIVHVLPGKPLALAREAVVATGLDGSLVTTIDMTLLRWHSVPAAGLRLWRTHGDHGELVTELAEGDPPVQVVADHDGWLLTRTLDGAMGWVREDTLPTSEVVPPADGIAAPDGVDAARFLEIARGFLGTPYVWGGTTESGVDCSGLVQRAAWRASRCWLPRHSTALLRIGRRVSPSSITPGDILVLRRRGAEATRLDGSATHPMHVAIAIDDGTALHASRDELRVVTEPITAITERFRVLGVRRLGSLGEDA